MTLFDIGLDERTLPAWDSFINGDCMEYMKDFPDDYFDLAIVDPPYGGNDAIGLKDNNNLSKQAANRKAYKVFKNVAPTQEYFDELKRVSKRQIIWGVNFYEVKGLTGGRIVWDKHGTAFGRAEEAYYSDSKSIEIFEYTWNGMIQENMKDKEYRIHPTPKPVALYKWLINKFAKEGDTILDTHVGSASSLIACHQTGHKYIGFEIDTEYYRLAKERLENETAQTNMFEMFDMGE